MNVTKDMTEQLRPKVKSLSAYTHVGRKGLERIDFLLLLIETLEINAVQSMIITSKNIGLDDEFPNTVELWKTRAHNPLRRASRRGIPSHEDVTSLVTLISATAERLYPLLRQILSNREPEEVKKRRWKLLSFRFNELIKERMNLRRTGIQNILLDKESQSLLRELVLTLALSSGPEGLNRLKIYINEIN